MNENRHSRGVEFGGQNWRQVMLLLMVLYALAGAGDSDVYGYQGEIDGNRIELAGEEIEMISSGVGFVVRNQSSVYRDGTAIMDVYPYHYFVATMVSDDGEFIKTEPYRTFDGWVSVEDVEALPGQSFDDLLPESEQRRQNELRQDTQMMSVPGGGQDEMLGWVYFQADVVPLAVSYDTGYGWVLIESQGMLGWIEVNALKNNLDSSVPRVSGVDSIDVSEPFGLDMAAGEVAINAANECEFFVPAGERLVVDTRYMPAGTDMVELGEMIEFMHNVWGEGEDGDLFYLFYRPEREANKFDGFTKFNLMGIANYADVNGCEVNPNGSSGNSKIVLQKVAPEIPREAVEGWIMHEYHHWLGATNNPGHGHETIAYSVYVNQQNHTFDSTQDVYDAALLGECNKMGEYELYCIAMSEVLKR